MPKFTFEVCCKGEPPLFVGEINLPNDGRTIWRHVEALAVQCKSIDGAIIRVKNWKSEVIVMSGAATARASIAECTFIDCSLKKAVNDPARAGGFSTVGPPNEFFLCESLGRCACELDGPGRPSDTMANRNGGPTK